jgi:hypothetical protein
MQFQAELRQALPEFFQKSLRLRPALEAHHQIVGIPSSSRWASGIDFPAVISEQARSGACVARTAAAHRRGEDGGGGAATRGVCPGPRLGSGGMRERDFRHGKAPSAGRPRRVLDPDQILQWNRICRAS